MTGDWVPLHVAVKRIREATGRHPKVADVHSLGGEDGPLIVEWLHDHYGVLESSLAAYLNDLAAHGGDDLAENTRPAWTPWSAADDPEAHRDRADYDEGDDD